MKIYELKKPSSNEKEETPLKNLEKLNLNDINNSKSLKDMKQHKGNIDKEKYFVVYKLKQTNKESEGDFIDNNDNKPHEKKFLQGKNAKNKERKLHSSNTPEKKGKNIEEGKFNSHFNQNQKENKNNNNFSGTNRQKGVVKEYFLKK